MIPRIERGRNHPCALRTFQKRVELGRALARKPKLLADDRWRDEPRRYEDMARFILASASTRHPDDHGRPDMGLVMASPIGDGARLFGERIPSERQPSCAHPAVISAYRLGVSPNKARP